MHWDTSVMSLASSGVLRLKKTDGIDHFPVATIHGFALFIQSHQLAFFLSRLHDGCDAF